MKPAQPDLELKADGFILRPWRMSDLESLVKYANHPDISKNLMDRFAYPYKMEDGINFIKFASIGNPVNLFCIEINGEAAGGIGLHLQEDIFRKMQSQVIGLHCLSMEKEL